MTGKKREQYSTGRQVETYTEWKEVALHYTAISLLKRAHFERGRKTPSLRLYIYTHTCKHASVIRWTSFHFTHTLVRKSNSSLSFTLQCIPIQDIYIVHPWLCVLAVSICVPVLVPRKIQNSNLCTYF